MSLVVVFDTNILISGTNWKGKPFECLELARQGVIEACTCEEILVEFKNVLKDKLLFGDARHLLPLAKYKSIAIVTPADFLKAAIHGKKS